MRWRGDKDSENEHSSSDVCVLLIMVITGQHITSLSISTKKTAAKNLDNMIVYNVVNLLFILIYQHASIKLLISRWMSRI